MEEAVGEARSGGAGLKSAVAGPGAIAREEGSWERISVTVEGSDREAVDEAMDLAGEILGATSPRWERLEAMCQEYLGAHPVEAGDDGGVGEGRVRAEIAGFHRFGPPTVHLTRPRR